MGSGAACAFLLLRQATAPIDQKIADHD